MQFVFDLDGTICFKGQPVSETILSCLEDLRSSGHEVIFASARPVRDILPVLHERFHHYPMVGGNGSLAAMAGQIVHAASFPDPVKRELLGIIGQYRAEYLIDSEWDYAYTGPSDHPILGQVDGGRMAQQLPVEDLSSIIKILILNADDMDSLADAISLYPVVLHRHHNEQVLDISPEGIHKWSTLQKLGLKEGEFIAAGNDANDITMFQASAHSIMIGEHPLLAPYASETIPAGEFCEHQLAARLRELGGI